MHMVAKQNVKFLYFTRPMLRMMDVVMETWTFESEPLVTSAFDGIHMKTSLHYQGLALDFRKITIPETRQQGYCNTLQAKLGKDYQVILEKDHIHIEYQPQAPKPQ